MADLQSLRIFTQILAGKCTNFGIVALIHLSVDKLVFNLDDLVFLANYCGSVIIDSIQYDSFLNIIAKRMKEEAQDLMEGCVGNSEPLSLLCMGGPGVSKSYISKAVRRLFDMGGYRNPT